MTSAAPPPSQSHLRLEAGAGCFLLATAAAAALRAAWACGFMISTGPRFVARERGGRSLVTLFVTAPEGVKSPPMDLAVSSPGRVPYDLRRGLPPPPAPGRLGETKTTPGEK